MALQGNLRDFSVTEILQLLGTQKKTGCLVLESNGREARFYLQEGRIVSTRQPGLAPDDPLLRFLLKAHRLSNEQYRGIVTIHRESNRDLEDLLVNGRYLAAEELSLFVERQILDDLMSIMTWTNGSYQFDLNQRWSHVALVKLGMEAVLIEAARRNDEQRRFSEVFHDPQQLIGVRDLPDADEHLSEEECELFGIIDGRRTLAEIAEEAPLSRYETYESLHRMLESGWIEIMGRRDPAPGGEAAPPPQPETTAPSEVPAQSQPRSHVVRELAIGLAALVAAAALVLGARAIDHGSTHPGGEDPYAVARLRDLQWVLDLYQREHGRYPEGLDELVADGWVTRDPSRIAGHRIRYRLNPDRGDYELELEAVR